MNAGKLKKQLIRDLKGSPKKAAFLGALLLVAAYFLAPLILGKPKTEAETLAPAEGQAATAEQATTPAGATTPRLTWRQLTARIAQDPRMTPKEFAAGENPLGVITQIESEPEPEPEVEAEAPEVVVESTPATPRNLGLTLSATLIGTNRRVALINGRPYAEGTSIRINREVEFVVKRISDRQAILERDGRQFVLRAGGADDDESANAESFN